MSQVNLALSAAFGLPAGAPGREGIVVSANRLRAGAPNAPSPEALLAVASEARRQFFAAQKAAKKNKKRKK